MSLVTRVVTPVLNTAAFSLDLATSICTAAAGSTVAPKWVRLSDHPSREQKSPKIATSVTTLGPSAPSEHEPRCYRCSSSTGPFRFSPKSAQSRTRKLALFRKNPLASICGPFPSLQLQHRNAFSLDLATFICAAASLSLIHI